MIASADLSPNIYRVQAGFFIGIVTLVADDEYGMGIDCRVLYYTLFLLDLGIDNWALVAFDKSLMWMDLK